MGAESPGPRYLSALKRTRRGEGLGGGSGGPFTGDTLGDLGHAVEDLIKHHAELRPEAMRVSASGLSFSCRAWG